MPDETPRTIDWWTTIPGVLTAAAAVISAIGGLIAVVSQSGILPARPATSIVGSTAPPDAPAKDSAAMKSYPQRSMAAGDASTAAPAWRFVRIVLRDGVTVDLQNTSLPVASRGVRIAGRPVDFAQVARIDLAEPGDVRSPGSARITLVDGTRVDGEVDPSTRFATGSDTDRPGVRWSEARSVEFVR